MIDLFFLFSNYYGLYSLVDRPTLSTIFNYNQNPRFRPCRPLFRLILATEILSVHCPLLQESKYFKVRSYLPFSSPKTNAVEGYQKKKKRLEFTFRPVLIFDRTLLSNQSSMQGTLVPRSSKPHQKKKIFNKITNKKVPGLDISLCFSRLVLAWCRTHTSRPVNGRAR